MVDAKATPTVLYELSCMPPESEPVRILTILNREHTFCRFNWIIWHGPNILDLVTEIIIICGLPHWISAQHINIAMPHSSSV
jgi:hypothetical protein